MIYEIVCNITNEKYIGGTLTTLTQRMYKHKDSQNICKSKQIIDRGDFTVKVIETLENPSKNDLLMREKYHINNNICINKQSPIRTLEEKIIYTKQYGAEYIKKNAKKIYDNKSQFVKCDCGLDVKKFSMSHHKKSKIHTKLLNNEEV